MSCLKTAPWPPEAVFDGNYGCFTGLEILKN
jgi:hypothetical protein